MTKKQIKLIKAQAALIQAAKAYDAANALYNKAIENVRNSEKGLTHDQLVEAHQHA